MSFWAGTDDGNLQVTRDGQTWKNVVDKIPGLAKGTYVSRVVASRESEGTAFATFDGHRSGDVQGLCPYMTSDFGEDVEVDSEQSPAKYGNCTCYS